MQLTIPVASGTHSFVGIDIGGDKKGASLCRIDWAGTPPTPVALVFVDHQYAAKLSTPSLRASVAQGNLAKVATDTYDSARLIAAGLWAEIKNLCPTARGLFIDSPSGFSRNCLGHGRLTEKNGAAAIFQQTPSIACGKTHKGGWEWLLYGVVAHAACLHSGGSFSLADWTNDLMLGLYLPSSATTTIIRECFPTATVNALRKNNRSSDVRRLLVQVIRQNRPEVGLVGKYLRKGLHKLKKKGSRFDRADALIAALSSMPHVRADFAETSCLPPSAAVVKWNGALPGDQNKEGIISIPI